MAGVTPEPTRAPGRAPTRAAHVRRARRDLVVLLVVELLLFVFLVRVAAFEHFAAWAGAHEAWQVDEALVALAFLAIGIAIYAVRRWRELDAEVGRREAAERARARLEGLLPICAGCKRIRDGVTWIAVEEYVAARTEAAFSHGICPQCRDRLYPDLGA